MERDELGHISAYSYLFGAITYNYFIVPYFMLQMLRKYNLHMVRGVRGGKYFLFLFCYDML
jgi:hypothetical protein